MQTTSARHSPMDRLWRVFGLRQDSHDKRPHTSVAPAIFHVTHWKAGSQWINQILGACCPDITHVPPASVPELRQMSFEPGKVYPATYVTREEFDSLKLPPEWKRFVVIRDLRDTLISAYFSLRYSHKVINDHVARMRLMLESVSSVQDGLINLACSWLPGCARIQQSWLDSGDPLIRYEDLLVRDTEILENVLLDHCGLPVSRERLRVCIHALRFENVSRGRARGTEDRNAHERRGIAGEWREHFTEPVKKVIKQCVGELLIKTGYEKDMSW